MDKEYIAKLEKIIKQMLKPLRGIPLNLVIEGLSDCKIIPFNKIDEKDLKVLEKLKNIADNAGNNVNKRGILRTRPNEVGNDIEPFVKEALNNIGYKANTPLTKNGRKKATGYPDIEFVDEFGRASYLECKTFNIATLGTSFRAFYLSPSEDFKITKDAHHFIISFEIYVEGRKNRKNIYKCKSWKILSIENLDVDVKYEFNSDNARLYIDELILAEGKL